MKNFLKSSTLGLLALALLAAVPARAQQRKSRELALVDRQAARDSRLISAKAGGVNFVSGDVKARRAGSQEWQGVTVKDDLNNGDSARTGADGRVEVLLNPGSYLRAGASTEFEFTDASLDNLRLRLARGSVFVEATGYDSLGLSIQINTPQTRVEIVRAGVYRVDVSQAGETIVSVQKGRALVGEGAAALLLKGGKEARVSGAAGVEVSKLQKKDKKQRDELELWSRERGKELAKANEALANKQTNSLLASYNGFYDTLRADFPNRFGFWFWNARGNCYTFLPFYAGWRSPYGFGYGSSFYYPDYYNCPACPSRAYRPVIINNANPSYTGTTNPTTLGVPSAAGGGSTGMSIGGAGTRDGGGGTVSPPRSAPVDRGDRMPRERTIEPGWRP